MRRLGSIVLFVASLGALGGLASCGDDDATAGPATVITVALSSTVTRADATTTSSAGQTPQPNPGAAATALMGAWSAGDRAAALVVADQPAVDALFAIPVQSVQPRGCNAGLSDPSYCVYRLDAGELQLRVVKRGDGWIVAGAILGT